jgi:hypothetical protein
MGIAVLNVSRKLTPVMRDFIGMLTGTENRPSAAGFIRSAKDKRSGKTSSNLSNKFAARC